MVSHRARSSSISKKWMRALLFLFLRFYVAFIIAKIDKVCVKFSFLTEILTSPCYDGHSNSERIMKMTHAKKAAAQVVLLIAGAAMLCFGAWRGEAATVFSKAIKLCLECVGIG